MEPAMLELVCNEIVEQGGHVQWNDIAGQEQAKRLVQELVVWPMLNPHLFKVCIYHTTNLPVHYLHMHDNIIVGTHLQTCFCACCILTKARTCSASAAVSVMLLIWA